MGPLTPKFLSLVSKAMQGGIEVTLSILIEDLNLPRDGYRLDNVQHIQQLIDAMDLELKPPLTAGDFDSPRVMRSSLEPLIDEKLVLSEISKGESSNCEFKSSLIYDHNKAKLNIHNQLQELKSDSVLYSSLRAVAGFLNGDGGILFIGVDNEGTCIGLKEDCSLIGNDSFTGDNWELNFRNHITGKFKDGNIVNDYIQIYFVTVNDNPIARICIQAKHKLSFIKKGSEYLLYRRQGNRTVEVKIEEIEDFIEFRRE